MWGLRGWGRQGRKQGDHAEVQGPWWTGRGKERGEPEMSTDSLERECEAWGRRRLQRSLRFQADGAALSKDGKMMSVEPRAAATSANTDHRVFCVLNALYCASSHPPCLWVPHPWTQPAEIHLRLANPWNRT